MKLVNYVFVTFLLTCLLTACGPMYNTEYSYIPPKSDMSKMCTAQCVQSKNSCEQTCRSDNDNCRFRAQQTALIEYNEYKYDRLRAGLPLDKTVSSFDRGMSCNASCNCQPTYRACYSACGGEVLERKVCVAFCDKAT